MLSLLTGCLQAPGSTPVDEDDDGDGDGASPGESAPDGGTVVPADESDAAAEAPCAGQFAVSYASRLVVDRAGGELQGVLVIEALGEGVDLSKLQSSDASFTATFALFEVSYVTVAPGVAHGRLLETAEDLIVGTHIEREAWAEETSPNYGLVFDPPADDVTADTVDATLAIYDHEVALTFEVEYQGSTEPPDPTPVPMKAVRVVSICD